MTLSINTNRGAMIALQTLNATNKNLITAQRHISTGLKINGPKDDASTYAIAQSMRGDIAGMDAVKLSLSGGISIVDTAIEGARAVSDLLIEMKAKAVQASQEGLDVAAQNAIDSDFDNMVEQLQEMVNSSKFNGSNLIDASITTLNVLSSVDGDFINVRGQDLNTTTIGQTSGSGQTISQADLSSPANALIALDIIDSAIDEVSTALAELGSDGNRLELQNDFTTKLRDILTAGVGNLVDADMAEESAMLTALQVKQQLGTQSLSIANQSPQIILSLFQ
jgi:flagellin